MNSSSNITTDQAEDALLKIPLYVVYILQGVLIPAGSFTIVLAIVRYEALRNNKEYVILCGLSLADGLKMVGYFFAGWQRLSLVSKGLQNSKTTAIACLLEGHNIFWSLGDRLSSMMLMTVSVDRLLAVLFPLHYIGWTVSYARRLISTIYVFHFLNVVYYTACVIMNADLSMPATCTLFSILRKTTHPLYVLFLHITTILFPSSAVIMFLIVIVALKKRFNSDIFAKHPNLEFELKRQRRTTITLLISVFCTIFVYAVPVAIGVYLFYFGYTAPGILFMCIANLNTVANICVYPMRHVEVRQAIVALLKRKHMPADLKMWNPPPPAVASVKSKTGRYVPRQARDTEGRVTYKARPMPKVVIHPALAAE